MTIDDNVTSTSMEADANTELVSLKINLDIHISNIDDLDKVPAKLSPILKLVNQHQRNIKLSNSKKKNVDKQNTKRKSRQSKRGKSEVKREDDSDSIETLF